MGMLSRVLEPEVMDTPDEAAAYDAMDHAAVNAAFVTDLLRFCGNDALRDTVLDLGTGTARIPMELCARVSSCRVLAVDLSVSMIELGRANVSGGGLSDRIDLQIVDAKDLPFDEGQFATTISNSIVHHIPDPAPVLAEVVRVTTSGGVLFFRDLLRPPDDAAVRRLVNTYAGDEDDTPQRLFDDSLRASLTLHEMRDIVKELGFDPASVKTTSDRHWTWATRMR
jgi:ubiquinone/menaquinone biosynthesis C-methylase UbiE